MRNFETPRATSYSIVVMTLARALISRIRNLTTCTLCTSLLEMKTRRTGSVLSLSKTRCKKKLRTGTMKWGRRILFVGSLCLILHLGNIIYSNTWKSETDYSSEDHELDEQVHHGRKLLSEGVVWEQCHFEKAHTPHAFLPLYIFLIFLLFVGKKLYQLTI